ncbi:MAG: protein kinase, partial [Myxococcales bacterium]|nr:protein kinase [Myxococcales bacterium]
MNEQGVGGACPVYPDLGERYRIDRLLGQGGMGEVYQCRDQVTDRTVALKRLRPDAVERRPVLQVLFEREYHALRELAHPSIVEVFDYGISPDGSAYYTMELLGGQDLRGLAPLPWREACALLRDVASSLAIMHSRRLLHRDVSPGNVHKDALGRAKLLDFGTMATFGVQGQIVGTPPCIAPEVVHNQPLDARSDLYALGALGYYLLSGRHAYPARRIDALRDFFRSRPQTLTRLVPDAPEELCDLLTSMISLDRMARPTSAGEVIERLTAIAKLQDAGCPDESADVARAYLKTPPLLGRDPQLVWLRKQMLRAARGRGSACIIEGASGIGRTRMLDALELEGKLAGATVLTAAACAGARSPYGVVASLAQSLVVQLPDLARRRFEPHGPAIAPVLPELVQQLSHKEPSVHPSAGRAGDMDSVAMAALADWIDGVADERTLVIAVDDLQGVDEPSLGIISALAHRAGRRRIALVTSVSTELQEPPAVTRLRRVAASIKLAPLDDEDIRRLVHSLFGEVPHVAAVAEWASRLARGKPRSCMELCEHLVERGIVEYRRGAWVLPGSLREEELPKSFEDALRARLQALSPDALAIAHAVVLTTLPLTPGDYAELLERTEDSQARSFAAVGELVAAGVLVGDGPTYRLAKHAYIEAIRSTLDQASEQRAHRRLAEIFRTRGNVVGVADHLLMAGDELEALGSVVAAHGVATGTAGSENAAAAMRHGQDTTTAVETRRRLLETCERHGRPEHERFILRRGIVGLAHAYNVSAGLPYVDPLIEQLRSALGLQHWDALGAEASDAERVRHCLAKAHQAFEEADERDRVLRPIEAIPAAVSLIGAAQSMARLAYDVRLLRRLGDFLGRLLPLSPRLEMIRDTVAHSHALTTGRVDAAWKLRQEMLEGYEQAALPDPANPDYAVAQIGRAIALHVEGYYWATRGSSAAEHWAALLEDPTHGLPEEGNAVGHLGHIWLRRASEIRYLMHLYNGDAREARRAHNEID